MTLVVITKLESTLLPQSVFNVLNLGFLCNELSPMPIRWLHIARLTKLIYFLRI